MIKSLSYPSEGRVFSRLKSENYVKYVVHAVSYPRQLTLPACSYDGRHHYIRKCSVDIRAEQKHKNEEETIPFSSPVPSQAGAHSETDQRWQSKWKQMDSRLLVLGTRGPAGDSDRVTVADTSCSPLGTLWVFHGPQIQTPPHKKRKSSLGKAPTGLFLKGEEYLFHDNKKNTKSRNSQGLKREDTFGFD